MGSFWERLVFSKVQARLGGRVRFIGTGSSPISPEVYNFLRCAFPEVHEGYGMTETCCMITMTDHEDAMIGHVGAPVYSCELKLVDVTEMGYTNADQPHPRGEICVRGPTVFQGYYRDEAQTRDCLDADGWFHTGDIGYVDRDGDFYVVDRVKELIKYKGYQVAPAELEALLLTHSAIADAAVIPSPNEEAGEIPKGFIVLQSPITEQEIIEWVASKVAPYKKIRSIEIVDEIPKAASGKILRRVLVEQERQKHLKS
jgi:acyl-CoA synthetase (AMP-forming)/AMP-acid ligase II